MIRQRYYIIFSLIYINNGADCGSGGENNKDNNDGGDNNNNGELDDGNW